MFFYIQLTGLFCGDIQVTESLTTRLLILKTCQYYLTVSTPANSMSTAIPVTSFISSSLDDKYNSNNDFASFSLAADCAKDSFFLDIKPIAILKDKTEISQSTFPHVILNFMLRQ